MCLLEEFERLHSIEKAAKLLREESVVIEGIFKMSVIPKELEQGRIDAKENWQVSY
jgi:hypothetical protein